MATTTQQTNPPETSGEHANITLAEALKRAIAFMNAGKSKEAEMMLQAILKSKPDQFDALHLLGVQKAVQGSYQEGINFLVQALKVNSNSAAAFTNLGNALQGAKRHEEALASYDKAIGIDPDYAEAHSNRGVVLHHLGRNADALASYERALALKPDYGQAIQNRNNLLKDLKRH